MNMMGEIDKILNSVDVSTDYRIVNIGGKKVYIEGLRSICYIKTDNILFKLKSKELNIVGDNLTIKYLDRNSCIIEGQIRIVEER